MTTPLSTPVRQARHGNASAKSQSMAVEYKKLFYEQHQRLSIKHQQDLDLIDDIRSYVKARLSIEREYSSALTKLARQHSNHISKKFALLNQCDPVVRHDQTIDDVNKSEHQLLHESEASDTRLQKRLANNGIDEPEKPCSLYKVWSDHIHRLQSTSKNRADQFEQLVMVADKLKDIRTHKASIGKKCLDTHLKRIHEDIVSSMIDVEKTRKLYYEDENQAKKARENEEKIKKKRSGLLTKFTDLQAKKEKTSAQREANDIQSTQARNDYIMALAAGNAHLQHYFQRDLVEFIHTIDDGVLDHCKIFMATLSECDINSLKDALASAQYWSKMINLTGSQKTNAIFLDCEQSSCLRDKSSLVFEPCNNDPVRSISLEHNADYALQHEIDKWFTWFKKECRNLSQLIHQLEVCQRAFAEGKKNIELNGQTIEDLEPKIIELKQQIRKCEAAKLKAQARLKVIKEGGMQIEEWSAVESEIRADMAQAQAELEAKRAKQELTNQISNESDRRLCNTNAEHDADRTSVYRFDSSAKQQVTLQISKDSDESDEGCSENNMVSVSRSTSNMMQKQQNATSGYSALTDPSLVWQDDFSNAWTNQTTNYNVVVSDAKIETTELHGNAQANVENTNRYDLLNASNKLNSQLSNQNQATTSMTVQSSSPLSAIVDGLQSSSSPYQAMMGEAYKSDYECDYDRNHMRSTASSVETYNQSKYQHVTNQEMVIKNADDVVPTRDDCRESVDQVAGDSFGATDADLSQLLDKHVITLYAFEKTNDDDLAFEENEILLVTDVNDPDWLRARNSASGQEGYIPRSYVRLLEPSELEAAEMSAGGNRYLDEAATVESEGAWDIEDLHQRGHDRENSALYCKAIYNYEPDADTYEDDGLPHLALVQGELMRVIDQGADDGWWLVEKESDGIKGHVPSMLVEELDSDADEHEIVDDVDECSDNDDEQGQSIKAMPDFEPPTLEAAAYHVEEPGTKTVDTEIVSIERNASSLVPTSFIIIEPTPEVESKSLSIAGIPIESSADTEQNSSQTTDDRQVIQGGTSVLPSDVSYSVINEDFTLEKPSRRPVCHSEQPDEAANVSYSDGPDCNYEPLSEVDSIDIPAPPSVVIDSFDDHKSNLRESEDDCEIETIKDIEYEKSQAYKQKEIRHTGNVDVSPLLRHRAEEFSKQIIAEAIMLAPGADMGPSTSVAYS